MAITVTGQSPTFWTADYRINGLNTSKRYDLVRIMEDGGDGERRYSVVGWRRDWQPVATEVFVRDYEAPLRPYRVALYDAALQTPIDWLFQTGPYAGPGSLQISSLIDPPAPADDSCRAIIRSSVQPELLSVARIAGEMTVEYPGRMGEHAIIGSKYPVFVVDRREGRRGNALTLYTPDAYQSELMRQVLLPDTGRIYPLWLRTANADDVFYHDLYFMPRDIEVKPATKDRPWRKFWRVGFTEIDPRSIVPRQFPDGLTQAALPSARITASPLSGPAPLTVAFSDTSLGTITDRKWDFNIGSSKYGTSTSQSRSITYREKGSFRVRLTVSGPGGKDNAETIVQVT